MSNPKPDPQPNPPPKPSKMALPRPSSHSLGAKGILSTIKLNHIRDNFDLSTWLLMGGTCGIFLSILPLPLLLSRCTLAILPSLLVWRALHTYLMIWGFVPNPKMGKRNRVGTVMDVGRAQGQGRREGETGCVVMIASQCTHPLGHLFPAYRFSEHTNKMIAELEQNPHSGFIGATSWINTSQFSSGNMIMTLLYFRERDDVLRFSRGRAHTKGAEWSKGLGGKGPGGGEYVGMYQENFVRGADW